MNRAASSTAALVRGYEKRAEGKLSVVNESNKKCERSPCAKRAANAGLGQIERLMFRGQDEQLRTGTQRSAARSSGQDQGPGVHATGAKADGRLSPFEQTPSLA